MKQQEAIKEYLLGALSDEAQRREIEEKILLNDDFNEQLLIAEDELIGEYLAGDLADAENKSFDRFFLITQERKQRLRLIRNLRKYAMQSETQIIEQSSTKKTGGFNWRGLSELFNLPSVRLAATAVLLIIVGVVVWRVAFYESDVDKGLAQLRAAYRGQRPTESRSTAGFEYAPLIVTRGSEPVSGDKKTRDRAYVDLFAAADNSTDAKAHHALGLYYLAEKQFDKALNEFNTALKFAPDDAGLQSDISAVYLEKAKQADATESGEVLENLARALQFVNRALEIDSLLLEALFNKALILQKMPQLTNQAREAWEEYLKKDSTSPWADEARKNLEELKQQSSAPKDKSQILQDFIDAFHRKDDARAWEIASQTKEMVEGVMIQQQLAQKFLEANRQSRKEESEKFLSAFVYLGNLEKQNAKDLYFSELADFYINSNQTQQQKLVDAYAELQTGNALLPKTAYSAALEAFYRARERFISAGSQLEARLVEHRIGYCLSRLEKIEESNELLIALSDFCEKKNYKWMQTLADGWIGSNYSLLGEHSKAINYNKKSLKTAEEISDVYDIQKSTTQLANEYWLIGDSLKTLTSIYRSLNFSNLYYQSSRQKSRNLLFATESLYRFKFYDAAAAFGREEIHVAEEELKDKGLSHTAYIHSALIYGHAQKYDEAFKAIDSSFQLAHSFEDEKVRKRQNTFSRLILAHLQREANDCQEAVANYDRVIGDYENSDFSINKYEARKGRFLCFVALKNDSAVKTEMPVLFQMFDDNRQKIIEESDRNVFFDNEQTVYDIAADYSFTQLNDSEQAFNYTENSRARSLLNLIENNPSKPLLLSEIRAEIPSQVQIVYYAVLDDKLIIWQVSNSNYTAVGETVKLDDLDEKIQNYAKLVADNKDSKEAAKELYQILIQPIESSLEADKALCIIADKMLFRVPFASLISPGNKYLIEDHTLFYAPSATLLINETKNAARKSSIQTEKVLAIGNPSFSLTDYPELATLPDAAKEAQKIAGFYEARESFVERSADKERILNNMDEADVVHFAGHYIPNGKSPALSKLLLAGGDLTIEEIRQKKLSRPRLMVLSACETGVEKFYRGEGMIGAARAFLASGVPMVVASQWAVDSDATAELMIRFHQYRKRQNLPTIEALRNAQIDMLTGEDSRFRQPFYWAGFLSVGGYAIY